MEQLLKMDDEAEHSATREKTPVQAVGCCTFHY